MAEYNLNLTLLKDGDDDFVECYGVNFTLSCDKALRPRMAMGEATRKFIEVIKEQIAEENFKDHFYFSG